MFDIFINGHNSTGFNSPPKSYLKPKQNYKKLLHDLSEIKKVSREDLHAFLVENHTAFSVLSLSAKHIPSTDKLTVNLTKNSARSFYLNKPQKNLGCQCLITQQIKTNSQGGYAYCGMNCSLKTWLSPADNCLTDPQNCVYFQLFNSKEKKLYTRFLDKVEANFEGKAVDTPLLFITLTFNTSQSDYYSWTTNWNKEDACWERLNQKQEWLKEWALNFDPEAEPLKVHLPQLSTDVSQYSIACYYLNLFLRRIRRLWKPDQWKWVVVAELQKNGNWHFHLLSTPLVPYSHKCVLDKDFSPCWNCCAYLSKLWPYGRVDSRSPQNKTISQYLAKYLSKSFHLRQLYQEHGLTEHKRTYRFFMNLYEYESKEAITSNGSKQDAFTGEFLPKNQKVFRHYDYQTKQTSYFYKTNEQLKSQCSSPIFIKKNYRLGTRNLNPVNLLKSAFKPQRKETFLLKKPPNQSPTFIQSTEAFTDFQEFLITNLLLFCQKAEFVHLPLEQTHVSKLKKGCDQTPTNHFKTKPLLRFTFRPETVPLILAFLNNLDQQADYYDMSESKDFYDPRIKDLNQSRNAYLNKWDLDTDPYQKEERVNRWCWGLRERTTM